MSQPQPKIETEPEEIDALATADTPRPPRTLGDTSIDNLWIVSRCRWGCRRTTALLPHKLPGWPDMTVEELQSRAKCSVCGRVVEISEQWGGAYAREGEALPAGFITTISHPGHAVVGKRFATWDRVALFCDCFEPNVGYWLVRERSPETRIVIPSETLKRHFKITYGEDA